VHAEDLVRVDNPLRSTAAARAAAPRRRAANTTRPEPRHTPFSVIFLTTLIGAGQGLFLALFGADLAGFGACGAGRSLPGHGGAAWRCC
jgi:hypothetical protein